jgi:hypothetical protein
LLLWKVDEYGKYAHSGSGSDLPDRRLVLRSAFHNNAGVSRDPESRKHENDVLKFPKASCRRNAHEPGLLALIAKWGDIMERKPATPNSTNTLTSAFFANQCQDSFHNHRLSIKTIMELFR